MSKRKEIIKGKYITYEDKQSLGETHDMLTKALPGQSYVKESMHKVSTTQVTGEALKKVSVGGKGGFGSQGDARDQAKQVMATSRVMVLSPPSQEAYDHKHSLEKTVKRFTENGVEYLYKGETSTKEILDPRRASKYYVMENGKWKRKWRQDAFVTITNKLLRDYDEFSHNGNWDPSDAHKLCEYYLTGDALEAARGRYDELCGYKGAWQYVGIDGNEHRRYVISIVNTLNMPIEKDKASKDISNIPPGWTDEHSTSRHHKGVYVALNTYKRKGEDEEYLRDWMINHNNDHGAYVMWYLEELKPEFWSPYGNPSDDMVRVGNGDWRWMPSREPSEEYLLMKDEAESLERKRKLEAFAKAPRLEDLKMVYKWELTKQGKTMFTNEKV